MLLHQGSALGLLIAGLSIPVITTHWGWRANFAVLALLGVVWCIAWAVVGEEGTLSRAPRTAARACLNLGCQNQSNLPAASASAGATAAHPPHPRR